MPETIQTETQETVSADELLATAIAPAAELSTEDATLRAVLEAIVYVTDEPLSAQQMAAALSQPIDKIKRLLDDGYQRAQNIIMTNRDKLELIANALLEHETLDRLQVEEIIKTGKFTPPPPKPQSGVLMGAPAGTPLPETPPKPVPPKLPGLGTPAPAPV